MAQIVPLTSDPNQIINTTLSIDGANKNVQLGLKYNEMAGYWVLSITDPSTQELLLDSLPLITGEYPAGNLLGQYAYLGLGAATLVNAGNVDMDYPDDTNLGTDFQLIWGDTI